MTEKTATPEMTELDGADIYPNWDSLVQGTGDKTPNKPVENEGELDISLDMLLDEKSTDYWQDLFNQMNFPGMDLMGVTYQPVHDSNRIKEHALLREKTAEFLKKLSNENVNDLRAAGIPESHIFSMGRGIMPVNWTIHLKYPLAYGGQIDFDNMVLIQSMPFHEDIHTFINKQILSKAGVGHPEELYIPVPPGKVYIPTAVTLIGGGGGKAAPSIPGKINGGR